MFADADEFITRHMTHGDNKNLDHEALINSDDVRHHRSATEKKSNFNMFHHHELSLIIIKFVIIFGVTTNLK